MDNTNEKIADIVKDMSFERRKAVSSDTKNQTKELLCSLNEARKGLDKLHLKLWYAVENNDYHSIDLVDAKQEIASITKKL